MINRCGLSCEVERSEEGAPALVKTVPDQSALALNIVVLYALTARWKESAAELTSAR